MDPPHSADGKTPPPPRRSLTGAGAGAPTLEIRLFYVRIAPCVADFVPPHLTLSHASKTPNPCSSSSLSLRRDRLDPAEVTYTTTDSLRLSSPSSFTVSDDRGRPVLLGSLDRAGDPSSLSPHHPSPSDASVSAGWAMDCCTAGAVEETAFVRGVSGPPSFEVYVAGCAEGRPLVLTQTVHLAPRRKAARTGGGRDEGAEDDDTVPEGSGRRRAPANTPVMEPCHSKPQPQAHILTYPSQHVNHPHQPQFASQTSQMQFQFQAQMVQPSSPAVQMIPQPHYQQPFLNSQCSQMQLQGQPQRSSQSQANDQSQSQEQLQCTNKRGTPNKRWKPNYDDFLIPFLVEQAKEGMKVDKTFKRHAFVAAAMAVNTRFHESFTWENVENHMRTLKTKYHEIKKCREFKGAIWNEDLKMITLDEATYQAYIEGNPKAKEYVNKPIENYEGLRIICGDEPVMKKSNFQPPKAGDTMDSYQDPVGHDEEVEAPVAGSTCTEVPTNTGLVAPASPSSSRNGRAYKRLRDNIESVIMDLARKVGDVAEAINNSRTTHWTAQLYEKIMDLDDFDATVQETAFDTLRQDEAEARAFIVKNKMMRFSWMERFTAERFSD